MLGRIYVWAVRFGACPVRTSPSSLRPVLLVEPHSEAVHRPKVKMLGYEGTGTHAHRGLGTKSDPEYI